MNKQSILKHAGSILFFLAITIVFFLPQFQGKELQQGDIIKWEGMVHETQDYYEKTGNNVAWCGSMFSGMPGYNVGIRQNYPNALTWLEKPVKFFNQDTGAIMLLSMLCGYVFFLVLGCSIPIAILGSLAFALSSYFPIIIEAGHATKGWVMAFMPLVLAGIFLIMKRKYIPGGLLFAFALTENLRHNHVQITFYLLILCVFLYIGYATYKVRSKSATELLKSTGVLLAGLFVAILLNSERLYANYEMSKTSIRGKSELTSSVDGKTDKSSGLDMDYAFAWSYGKAETFTFLIPNLYGGASGSELGKQSNLAQAFKKNGYQTPNPLRTYTYWGDQPFTSGPVYFGAIICFLFVLSLLIVERKYKWWVVAATAFLIIMSWGKNLMGVNEFLFHHLPFYNKFRTPSMALVIPQLTFVWFACLALKDIYEGKIEEQKLKKSLYISAGITGGICLIFAVMPSVFFSFSSALDATYQLPEWYQTALLADREDLMVSDAWRSFFFIAVAFAVLFITSIKLARRSNMVGYGIIAIAVLSFFDLWQVDRRYLNETNFTKKNKQSAYKMTEADKFILEDKSPSYRVLSLNNPFNDTNVSYFHKSIGGYNAAKLRRYQDLIEQHIEPEMRLISNALSTAGVRTLHEADSVISATGTPVLDMLNMRYLIINPDMPAATNHSANGNAWFVNEVRLVANADEEMKFLSTINPKQTAVVDETYSSTIGEGRFLADSTAKITMTSYEPIRVKYKSTSEKDGIALFSEVYYPHSWEAYIDGQKTEHFRANWILRGLKIPAGKHEIEFKHNPSTYWNLTATTSIGSFLLIFAIIAFIAWQYMQRNKPKDEQKQIG